MTLLGYYYWWHFQRDPAAVSSPNKERHFYNKISLLLNWKSAKERWKSVCWCVKSAVKIFRVFHPFCFPRVQLWFGKEKHIWRILFFNYSFGWSSLLFVLLIYVMKKQAIYAPPPHLNYSLRRQLIIFLIYRPTKWISHPLLLFPAASWPLHKCIDIYVRGKSDNRIKRKFFDSHQNTAIIANVAIQ